MSKDASKSRLTAAHLLERLEAVVDPEFGINIVDLGLVYDVSEADGHVIVEMTLTSIGCPVGDYLVGKVREAIEAVQGVVSVEVRLVWEPPWSEDWVNPSIQLVVFCFFPFLGLTDNQLIHLIFQ